MVCLSVTIRKEVIKLVKTFRIFLRSIRDAFKSISRNFSLSMASVLSVTITLIIVAVAIIMAANVNYATKNIEDEMNILVYIKNDAKEDDVKNVLSEIKAIKGVREFEHISKEQQKNEMAEYDETLKTILNYLEENPLMDSVIVYVDDIKDMSSVAGQIKEIPSIETVKYGEEMVEDIVHAFDIIQKITVGLVIALMLVTIFLISNTIKLTIYSRKSEIEIMRLVGASNMAIKTPFVVEGLIIGLVGSIIPVCVTIYGYVILYNAMNGFLFSEMLKLVKPFNFVFMISAILVVFGALVGMFGSAHAVRKYLKI